MYNVYIKFTNGDELTVFEVYEVQEKSNNEKEVYTYSEEKFCSVYAYSNFSYSFIGKNEILTVLGLKVEYLLFRKV